MQTIKRSMRLTPTISYFPLNTHFATPMGIPYTSLDKIAMPFSNTVWMAILVVCFLAIITLILIKYINYSSNGRLKMGRARKYLGYSALILNIINTLLGGSTVQTPIRHYARFGFIIWLFATFILRNAYLGSMINFLQAPIYNQPIDTIEKVLRFNYSIYAAPVLHDVLYENSPALRKLLSHIEFIKWYQSIKVIVFFFRLRKYDESTSSPFDHLKDISFRGVIIIRDISALYHNTILNRDSNNFISISKEKISTTLLVFYLRKHSCLTAAFNKHLLKMISSGLIGRSVKEYRDMKYLYVRRDKAPKVLLLDQVVGVFLLCFGLYAIALFVFLLEMVSIRIVIIRKCLDIVR